MEDKELSPEEGTGPWWSVPRQGSTPTSRAYRGATGLWWEEDTFGYGCAEVINLAVDPEARVFTITGESSWARLCRDYPLDVTADKQYDWQAATGLRRPWVMPDWSRVIRDFDAVHLTVAGYLGTAGRAIKIGERSCQCWQDGHRGRLTGSNSAAGTEEDKRESRTHGIKAMAGNLLGQGTGRAVHHLIGAQEGGPQTGDSLQEIQFLLKAGSRGRHRRGLVVLGRSRGYQESTCRKGTDQGFSEDAHHSTVVSVIASRRGCAPLAKRRVQASSLYWAGTPPPSNSRVMAAVWVEWASKSSWSEPMRMMLP